MTDRSPPALESDSPYARFRIGRGLALVAPPVFVLVDPANGALGERLWSLMEENSGVDGLLEELSAAGLRTLGDFAMAQIEDDELRVIVRGQARAAVLDGETSVDLEAGSVKTWVEAVFGRVTGFALSIGELANEELLYRLERGVVPADQVHWGEFQRSSLQLEGVGMGWTDSFEPTDVGRRRSSVSSGAAPAGDLASTVGGGQIQASVDADGKLEDGDVDDYDFDALYGRTVAKSVQGAAVATVDEDEQPPASPDESATAVDGARVGDERGGAVDERTLAPTSETGLNSGLIDAVPPRSGYGEQSEVDALDPAGVESPAERQLGDHDGMTISASRLRELRGQSVADGGAVNAASHSGPAVQALMCPQGHPNPTHLDSCRHCAEALSGPPVVVPRPSLGRLVFSTGRTIELDRPAIIGRSPKAQGSMPNEMPQLVTLDGDDLLSRSHAMIRPESWHVLVEDLGSRNGTTVALPGREPRRLMAGEPVMLESGAVIEFSDDVSATYQGIE